MRHVPIVLAGGVVVVLGLLAVVTIIAPSQAAPPAPSYGIEIAITPASDQPRVLDCNAILRDLTSGEVVLSPRLLTRWGEPAQVTSDDRQSGLRFEVTVSVDASGQTASYKTLVRKGGEKVLSHEASVRING